jgi:hypothetical protein
MEKSVLIKLLTTLWACRCWDFEKPNSTTKSVIVLNVEGKNKKPIAFRQAGTIADTCT